MVEEVVEEDCSMNVLGNNLYAMIPIVMISGEDAPTTGSTGAAQRIQTSDLLRQLKEERKKLFQSR